MTTETWLCEDCDKITEHEVLPDPDFPDQSWYKCPECGVEWS